MKQKLTLQDLASLKKQEQPAELPGALAGIGRAMGITESLKNMQAEEMAMLARRVMEGENMTGDEVAAALKEILPFASPGLAQEIGGKLSTLEIAKVYKAAPIGHLNRQMEAVRRARLQKDDPGKLPASLVDFAGILGFSQNLKKLNRDEKAALIRRVFGDTEITKSEKMRLMRDLSSLVKDDPSLRQDVASKIAQIDFQRKPLNQ